MNTRMKLFAAIARDFLRSKRGNVAMMFGVMLMPLMIGAGAGLDFARAMMVRQQMAEALDAAALAVGSTAGMDATKAQELATKYFNANYTVDKSQYGTVTIDPPVFDAKGSITLTAKNSMPTLLMKLAGITDLPLSTTSKVVWGQTKLWVALVLDNSGSMDDADGGVTKMSALKSGAGQLLTVLENAANTPGDVKVGIVPFTRSVNMADFTADIDWGEWDAPPSNVAPIDTTLKWGDACPFTSATHGFRCRTSSVNGGGSNTSTIPSSGLICPGIDDGSKNTAHKNRYYNGCWDTVATQTVTTTKVDTTPKTKTQTCTQVDSGTINCNTGSTSTGTTTTNTTTATTAGYTGDSTNTSTNTTTGTITDGTKSCTTTTKKPIKTTCTWTRTTPSTDTKTTVTATHAGPYTHTWHANAHSSWSGCVMDRQRITGSPATQTYTTAGFRTAAAIDYDLANTQPDSATPDTQFPAANPNNCPAAKVSKLGYDWTALGTQITSMVSAGSTNQAIGVAHGWQMVTPGKPYDTPGVPANTTRYIILFSDGLNTMNRWWGDGSTEGTTEDGYIDDREKAACAAAKADGVVIYTIFLDIGGTKGDSKPLEACASDSKKYFALTSNSAVVSTFDQIAQEITNVRVSM